MRKLAVGTAVLAAGAAVLMLTATAFATPSTDFTTVQLSKARFAKIDVKTNDALPHQVKVKTKGESDVYVVENTVKPGGSSGWHTHAGPSLITVKSGTATFYDSDDPTCTPHVVSAGAGVIDPGDGHVHLLRNEGNVDLVTVTVQILPAGADRRIDAPRPGNCPF
jgi:quercetin dioxygenase-like cupin family protein